MGQAELAATGSARKVVDLPSWMQEGLADTSAIWTEPNPAGEAWEGAGTV
jgi:hypothetical protein